MTFAPLLAFEPSGIQQTFQLAELNKLLGYLHVHSPFYQRMWKANANIPKEINVLEELSKFPFTTKEDLQCYEGEFRCVPTEQIIEYTTTSGTLGNPITIALTEKDLQRLAYNEEQSFKMAGINAKDTVQLLLTLDKQFMAGMAYYMGLRKIGATIVRAGPGVPGMQWAVQERSAANAWVAVPSFLLKLLEHAEASGIAVNERGIKKVLCIGEPIRQEDLSPNKMSEAINKGWDVQLFGTYAATEMQAAFTECEAGKGGHFPVDLLIVELVDNEGEPVKTGDIGEVVITTLGIEGMPLLRYKTGDLCKYHTEVCSCGRHSYRLGPVLGRKQQMIKLKGTSIYPQAIKDVLEALPQVQGYVLEVTTDTMGNDALCIYVAMKENPQHAQEKLLQLHHEKLRIKPQIKCVSLAEIQQMQEISSARKPKIFLDKRTIHAEP